MRLNWDTVLVGKRVVLVPYRERYVAPYHAWMQDDALLEQTASERLTLAEERANQASWRDDDTKLTFIVLAREACFGGDRFPAAAMAGDCNLFLDRDGAPEAEVEVMVAERKFRRRASRRGRGAPPRLRVAELHVRRFFAKVGDANGPSRRLFEGTLGFEKCNYVAAFKETELERVVEAPLPLARDVLRRRAGGGLRRARAEAAASADLFGDDSDDDGGAAVPPPPPPRVAAAPLPAAPPSSFGCARLAAFAPPAFDPPRRRRRRSGARTNAHHDFAAAEPGDFAADEALEREIDAVDEAFEAVDVADAADAGRARRARGRLEARARRTTRTPRRPAASPATLRALAATRAAPVVARVAGAAWATARRSTLARSSTRPPTASGYDARRWIADECA
ncbi:transferase [Aureococcus anophagefferens]|nr:transferase [Aureococcus anophagefferens]